MGSAALVLAFFMGTVVAAETSAAPVGATEQELIQLELDYCAAQIARKADFFANILDEQYTQIGSRGTVQGKADVLAGLQDATTSAISCAQSNVRARIYGDAAVVTGLTNAAGVYKGIAYKDRLVLWTDTFIRRDGQWKLVATQSTAVPRP